MRDICGLHAQLTASAELTLWARVDGLERDAVSRALWEDRTLVQTWAQRGTLHLLRADELGLWVGAQSALKPRHHVGSWLRHHGLTREQADAMLDAIPVALDGKQLTREELAAEVARLTGIKGLDDKLKGGFGDLLKPAAFRGDLCFAPSDGQRVRFARPDQWLGPWKPMDTEEATLEVTRRYLARYGPANREDLARWFGMHSPAEAGRWLKRLGRRGGGGRRRRTCSPPTPRRRRRRSRPARCGSCRPSTSTSSPRRAATTTSSPAASARAGLPAAGLAVAGAARRRPHGRRLVARAHRASG